VIEMVPDSHQRHNRFYLHLSSCHFSSSSTSSLAWVYYCPCCCCDDVTSTKKAQMKRNEKKFSINFSFITSLRFSFQFCFFGKVPF
jgi:hypothetical protein